MHEDSVAVPDGRMKLDRVAQQQPDGERKPAPVARAGRPAAPPMAKLGPEYALALQRSVGNSAVASSMLQREPESPAMKIAPKGSLATPPVKGEFDWGKVKGEWEIKAEGSVEKTGAENTLGVGFAPDKDVREQGVKFEAEQLKIEIAKSLGGVEFKEGTFKLAAEAAAKELKLGGSGEVEVAVPSLSLAGGKVGGTFGVEVAAISLEWKKFAKNPKEFDVAIGKLTGAMTDTWEYSRDGEPRKAQVKVGIEVTFKPNWTAIIADLLAKRAASAAAQAAAEAALAASEGAGSGIAAVGGAAAIAPLGGIALATGVALFPLSRIDGNTDAGKQGLHLGNQGSRDADRYADEYCRALENGAAGNSQGGMKALADLQTALAQAAAAVPTSAADPDFAGRVKQALIRDQGGVDQIRRNVVGRYKKDFYQAAMKQWDADHSGFWNKVFDWDKREFFERHLRMSL